MNNETGLDAGAIVRAREFVRRLQGTFIGGKKKGRARVNIVRDTFSMIEWQKQRGSEDFLSD